MKCKPFLRPFLIIFGCASSLFISLSCQESLPVQTFPDNVIALNVSKVEQYDDHVAPPGKQKVHIVVMGENIYDEVFWDSVNIKGSMRIWWKRKPVRYRTLYLTEKNLTDRSMVQKGKLMLLPGQRFSLDVYWDIRSDGGLYLPSEMDFSRLASKQCDYNVSCGVPEDFVIEISLNIYDRLGYLLAPAMEFTFYPRICKCAAYPPCGTGGEC